MANKVTINDNMSKIITINTPGPKGDKGDSFGSDVSKTIHFSGSQFSGSILTAITVTGSILPQGNGIFDLGSATNPFRDLYITTESLKFVSRTTGRVVSSLSAQNVEDLKVGKTITTTTKTLNRKDGTTTTRTKFIEGAAFISSLDNDVYIKTGTNRMTLVAGGSGTGNIDIGGVKQKTNMGSVNITGSLKVTGSFIAGRFINSGSIDFVASSSQFPFEGGTILTFDNQYHHLSDANGVYNGAFSPNSENAKTFYVGNFITSNLLNQTPEVGFVVSSSGKTYIGPYLENSTTRKKLNATLHISGNSPNYNALLVEGNISSSKELIAEKLNLKLSATCSGLLSDEPIYAPAFIETGTGTPTIESNSNLVLSASNAVVIASSPLRLRSFTDTVTGSGQFTFVAGDTYFNSTTNKFMGFNGSSHVVLG